MTTPVEARLTPEAVSPSRTARAWGFLGRIFARPLPRALVKAAITIFVATSLTFFIFRLMPGNPVEIYIGTLISEQGMSYAEAADQASGLFNLDLDAPMHEQYLNYLRNLLTGNLGTSLLSIGAPVTDLILKFLPWTLFFVGTALLLSFVVGVFLGLLAAYRRNSMFDHVVSTSGSLVSSIPDYLIGLLLIVFLGAQGLQLLPIAQMRGSFTSGIEPGLSLDFIGDIFFHAALPITTIFLGTVGIWILSMKNATMATLEEDYVTAARARGLPDGRITTAYVGRNAILPLVGQLAISAGFVVGGAVLIEFIFVYQGVGLLLFKAIESRDYPVMQGCVLVIITAVVLANVVADLLYSRLDPRIGRAGGAGG